MKRKILFGIIFLLVLAAALFFWRANFLQKNDKPNFEFVESVKEEVVSEQKNSDKNDIAEGLAQASDVAPEKIEQKKKNIVPFTSQAPFGDWSDERFQNGCEEASIAMAMRWTRGETFSSAIDAQNEILDIAKFEEKTFGNHIDASLVEVGQILLKYYNFENYSIKQDITLEDLKKEVESGNVVLVPAFGRALGNPNFTRPGPITHMLVIVGYDESSKNFITNDPGTKRGEKYPYNEKVLFDAIWEYPSGAQHPNLPKVGTMKKGMLIIKSKEFAL